MSDTIVDMPKVAQMLDAGWLVRVYKGGMGSYEVRAHHPSPTRMKVVIQTLVARLPNAKECEKLYGGLTPQEVVDEYDFDEDDLMTDDFTPEQALTRMAYKIFGEII